MTVYELIKENETLCVKLINAGVISFFVTRDIELYEAFTAYRRTLGKMQSASNTATDFKISERRVFGIVRELEKIIANK